MEQKVILHPTHLLLKLHGIAHGLLMPYMLFYLYLQFTFLYETEQKN